MNKLKKLTHKTNPSIMGVLIKDGKAVATNSYALIERELKDDKLKDINVIINPENFKAGDKINPDKTITRKDGAIYTPKIIDDYDFPDCKTLFPDNLDNHSTARITKRYLIELLNAIEEDEIEISILGDSNVDPVVIKSKSSRGLIMPIRN